MLKKYIFVLWIVPGIFQALENQNHFKNKNTFRQLFGG